MNNFLNINKLLLLLIPLFLISCGDNDGGVIKLTKGHRDAIKIQCEDSSNKEACNSEVRANFISDGNDYANFGDLTKDQIDSCTKWCCEEIMKVWSNGV